MTRPWMSVVVPAYNEETAIADILAALHQRLGPFGRDYELIVVDNASEDRTVEVVEPLLDGKRVRLLRNEVNLGKGFSVRRGMLDATGDLRLLCDADCGPSLGSLPRMLEAVQGADVVAGSRVAEGACVDRQQPFRRRLFGWPFIALTRMIMREPTRDVYCGFKLWRSEAAEAVFSRQQLDGWVFDAESLAMARRLGFSVREVGITWADRRGSKLSVLRVLATAVPALLTARGNVRAQPPGGQPKLEGLRRSAASAPDVELVAEPGEPGG
ncbi:MAG: glycosyltransferase [Thermoleophilaceae bacterium]|nr:glycosyltransferase [Thermoleophilaceae bacterium]